METRPEIIKEPIFSGLTCPECRGPLWEEQHGKIKEYVCRVGHTYSFQSMLEQHAVTTERALWTAAIALEEAVILAQQAAQNASDSETKQAYEREAQAKEKQAALVHEILTKPDSRFAQLQARA